MDYKIKYLTLLIESADNGLDSLWSVRESQIYKVDGLKRTNRNTDRKRIKRLLPFHEQEMHDKFCVWFEGIIFAVTEIRKAGRIRNFKDWLTQPLVTIGEDDLSPLQLVKLKRIPTDWAFNLCGYK